MKKPNKKKKTNELDDSREPDIEALDLSKIPNPLARSVKVFQCGDFNIRRTDASNARLFVDPEVRDYIMTLDPKSKALLLWMVYEVEWGKDVLQITHKRVKKYYKVDIRTYNDAVNELVKKEIILMCTPLLNSKKKPSTTEGLFWFNPHVFFRGQRFAFYRRKMAEMGEMKYLSPDPDLHPGHEQLAIPASKSSRPFPPKR